MSYPALAFLILIASPALPQARTPYQSFTAYEAQWRADVLPRLLSQAAVAAVDSEASQYVAALGNRLTYASPRRPQFRYRFILYDDSVGLQVPWFGALKSTSYVNALPGGIVLVPLRLFEVSADEAEFASAIARGIAHVVLKHFARTDAQASVVRPIPPAGPQPLEHWQPFPRTLMFLRGFEWEADHYAAGILAGTGVNPEALTRHVRNGSASFDTSDARTQALKAAMAKLPRQPYGPDDSPQFAALKERVGGVRVAL